MWIAASVFAIGGGTVARASSLTADAASPGIAANADRHDAELRGAAKAAYREGLSAEKAFAFRRAAERYRRALDLAPAFGRASHARARLADLERHSEGDFLPLTRLERIRRDPKSSSDPAALEALLNDAKAFPPGPVRIEARWLAIEAFGGRLNRDDRALALLPELVDDPEIDPLTKRQALRLWSELLLERGDADGALRVAARLEGERDSSLEKDIARRVRHDRVRVGSMVILSAFFAIAALAIARGWRQKKREAIVRGLRRFAPTALLTATWIALGGGWLVSRYDASTPLPFVAMGATAIAIGLTARAWALAASAKPTDRAMRSLFAVLASMAAAFLILDRIDATYLTPFGL